MTKRLHPAPSQTSGILPGQNPTEPVKTRKALWHLKVAFFSFYQEWHRELGKAGLTSQGSREEVSRGCGGRGRRSRGSLSRHKWRCGAGREGWEGAQSSALGDGRLESPVYEAEINAEKCLER